MARVIRFRAWDGKKMYEPFDMYMVNPDDGWFLPDTVLLQFTGLHDTNGKEIYEGDVLKLHNKEEDDGMGENFKYRKVKFEQGAFTLHFNFGEYDVTALGWALDWLTEAGYTYEVSHNIYENPDLLT